MNSRKHNVLEPANTVLVLVDIQGKLAEIMHENEALVQNVRRLILGARALAIPIIWTEQIPEKMGPTIPGIQELLTSEHPISKKSFSCCGEPRFTSTLKLTGKKQVLLAGIETHVCVFQTSADLIKQEFEVHVPADAVSSRTPANKQIGLDRINSIGAQITSVESALFEMLKTSEHTAFRDILKIVK